MPMKPEDWVHSLVWLGLELWELEAPVQIRVNPLPIPFLVRKVLGELQKNKIFVILYFQKFM